MKKVLITGKDSYIGTSVERWLLKEPEKYTVETLDMKNPNWKDFDFSKFDVVFHVAGIAHIKETKENKELYYKVNRDLAYETAIIAKDSGVKQFIFLSTMSVYGLETGIITKETLPNPKNAYGKSKLEAETLILALESVDFNVSVLRPPMVYGPKCPGNYQRLSNLATKLPFYPAMNNERSMVFIDNLSDYIADIIDSEKKGILFPQNNDYVNVTKLISAIRSVNGKKKKELKVLNIPVKIALIISKQMKKVFGTLKYDIYDDKINKYTFEESIEKSEGYNG